MQETIEVLMWLGEDMRVIFVYVPGTQREEDREESARRPG